MTRETQFDDGDWDDDDPADADDDGFDYDEFVENEFGGGRHRSQHSPLVRLTAWILLLVFAIATMIHLGF